jgi:hypothetical protein
MGMRRDDPKRIAAEKKRDEARIWLEILCQGIGHSLTNGEARYYPENVRLLIQRVNGELSEAVDDEQRASKAYEPYWRGRRRRRVTIVRPKKTKAA